MKRMRTGKKEENRKKFVFPLHVICSVFTKIVLYKTPSSFLRARTKNLYTLQDLYNIYLYKVSFTYIRLLNPYLDIDFTALPFIL